MHSDVMHSITGYKDRISLVVWPLYAKKLNENANANNTKTNIH